MLEQIIQIIQIICPSFELLGMRVGFLHREKGYIPVPVCVGGASFTRCVESGRLSPWPRWLDRVCQRAQKGMWDRLLPWYEIP